MYKLLKKMGLDPKIIENKLLRKELCTLLAVFTKNYKFYGKPYKKNLFTKERTIYGELTEGMLLEMANDESSYGEIVDDMKECITIDGYNKVNKQSYSFDVIHDLERNTYTILGYPTITKEFCSNDFLESFSINYDPRIYNPKLNTLTSKKISKSIDCDLRQETHTYSFGVSDNRLLLVSTYETYDGNMVEQLEREYIDKLKFKPNYIYKPGDTTFMTKLGLKYGRCSTSSRATDADINYDIPIDMTTICECNEEGIYHSYDAVEYVQDNDKTLLENEIKNIQNYIQDIFEEKCSQKQKMLTK